MLRSLVVPILACGLAVAAAVIIAPAPKVLALPPKNLKFYDKDMSQPKIYREMKGISRELGVKCAFCHVMTPRRLFHKDTNPHKGVALEMLRLTKKNNEDIGKILEQESFAGVNCYTCHSGAKSPSSKPDDGESVAAFEAACEKKEALAEKMEAFTKDLNKQFRKLFPKEKAKITCYTCHKGQAIPATEKKDD